MPKPEVLDRNRKHSKVDSDRVYSPGKFGDPATRTGRAIAKTKFPVWP